MINNSILEFKIKYSDTTNKVYTDKNTNWLTKLFAHYQYFNSDDTMLSEINDLVISDNSPISMYISTELTGDNHVFLSAYNSEDVSLDSFENFLNSIDKILVDLYNVEKTQEVELIMNKTENIFSITNDNLQIIILDKNKRTHKNRVQIKELSDNYVSKLNNIDFVIFFKEDIEELINDVENPVFSVPRDTLKLISKELVFHGKEKSFIASVGAKSLKEIFVKHHSKGLFSSNLRYYVKSAKIDNSIKETIQNQSENFWYYNNGIIITCEDYIIKNDQIELYNFSIVNGGQTTNLIGNTEFEDDFGIVCKVIKNKYDNDEDNLEFLSTVAETSNTQKPIRAKDIIANRVEQRRLRKQLAEVDVFLQIKRGEKINKKKYSKQWQNAKNDELGQMLFSFIYQHPGIARNSKSKMLENNNYYKTIYGNSYNSFLLLSLQHVKVGYNIWKKKVVKENESLAKVSLSKYSMFMVMSILGLLIKIYYNKELEDYLISLPSDFNFDTSLELKNKLSQNDIGNSNIFKNPDILSSTNILFNLYDLIYESYLKPSYDHHKIVYPMSSYATFTKNDTNYYRHVVPTVIKNYNKFNYLFDQLMMEDRDLVEISAYKEINSIEDLPGLGEELREYRLYKFRESNGKIKAYEVFTNLQMSNLINRKPTTLEDLIAQGRMKKSSVSLFGKDIINIISKYKI